MKTLNQHTAPLRYNIVKLVAPTIYNQYIKNRPLDNIAKTHFGNKPILAAEVGVYRGEHAKQLLENLYFEKLYLIDNWCANSETSITNNAAEAENNLTQTQLAIAKHAATCQIIKADSTQAAQNFHNNTLDYVYLDAGHTYQAVKADIEAYHPKIKSGGILGGHDFNEHWTGLVKAVSDFAYENDYKLFFCSPDWWIIKR